MNINYEKAAEEKGRDAAMMDLGIDRSLLDPQLSSSVTQQGKTKGNATLSEISRQRRAYDIADSIQRGDYFRQIETPKKK